MFSLSNPISTSVIIALGISTFCTTLVPILITVVLLVKKVIHYKPFSFGFLCFFVTQLVLRIPIMSILSQFEWFRVVASNVWAFSFIVGGLTAALFEETGRLGLAKTLLKNNLTYKFALSFGLGHAFCEIILLMGMSNISNFAMVLLVNSDRTSTIGAAITPEIIEEMVQAFTSSQIPAVYLGIVERVCSTILHVFATILVFKSVSEKKHIYFVYAILAHTLFNGISGVLINYTGIWVTELFIVVTSAFLFIYIKKYHDFCVYNGTLE